MKPEHVTLSCPHCDSEELVRDASARWNGDDWELSDVHDAMHCESCEHDLKYAIKTMNGFGHWTDAKHYAREETTPYGRAWIIKDGDTFTVRIAGEVDDTDDIDDAPYAFAQEFINGEEQ
jgi:copper chaperone CopZ